MSAGLKIIGLVAGDPAGVGPELLAKAIKQLGPPSKGSGGG